MRQEVQGLGGDLFGGESKVTGEILGGGRGSEPVHSEDRALELLGDPEPATVDDGYVRAFTTGLDRPSGEIGLRAEGPQAGA